VKVRFFYSAGANLLRGLLSFLTSLLLARWLGPVEFGDMAFLLGTFLGVRQFLDMGTSSAFFTFISQQPRSWTFIRNFIYWLAFQFIVPVVVVLLIFPDVWIKNIWHDNQRSLLVCAFMAVFAQNTLWMVAQSLAESARKTIYIQKIGVIISVVHLFAIIALFRAEALNLYIVFTVIFIEYTFSFFIVANDYRLKDASKLKSTPNPSIVDYIKYCAPLVPLLIFAAVQELADRWLLQRYGGSISQGYYAFSYQIAGVAVMFISAVVKIFWKEIAELSHNRDHTQLIKLFSKVLRVTRTTAAFFSGFIAVFAHEIIMITVGEKYQGAYLTMSILSMYVAYMAVGQIYSTLLMATGKVQVVSYMGSFLSILSALLAYIMLATELAQEARFENAAENIAVKMLAIEFIASIIYAMVVKKIWSIDNHASVQFFCLVLSFGIAWLSRNIVSYFVANDNSLVIISGGFLVYMLAFGSLVYAIPGLLGLCDDDLPNRSIRT
jgi:O-antigen/teichoic acid export membrane protein